MAWCLVKYRDNFTLTKGSNIDRYTAVLIFYPEVSGLAASSENCKWYSSLPLDAVV
jgi:hypothetical protein